MNHAAAWTSVDVVERLTHVPAAPAPAPEPSPASPPQQRKKKSVARTTPSQRGPRARLGGEKK